MGTDQFTGMRLPRVNEDPGGVGMSIGRFTQQRTLCRTIRSGKGSEFQNYVAFGPKIRQPYGGFIVEPSEQCVWGRIAGMEMVREGRELGELGSRFHVFVKPVVVVLTGSHPLGIYRASGLADPDRRGQG
jgi:hypothetical protein